LKDPWAPQQREYYEGLPDEQLDRRIADFEARWSRLTGQIAEWDRWLDDGTRSQAWYDEKIVSVEAEKEYLLGELTALTQVRDRRRAYALPPQGGTNALGGYAKADTSDAPATVTGEAGAEDPLADPMLLDHHQGFNDDHAFGYTSKEPPLGGPAVDDEPVDLADVHSLDAHIRAAGPASGAEPSPLRGDEPDSGQDTIELPGDAPAWARKYPEAWRAIEESGDDAPIDQALQGLREAYRSVEATPIDADLTQAILSMGAAPPSSLREDALAALRKEIDDLTEIRARTTHGGTFEHLFDDARDEPTSAESSAGSEIRPIEFPIIELPTGSGGDAATPELVPAAAAEEPDGVPVAATEADIAFDLPADDTLSLDVIAGEASTLRVDDAANVDGAVEGAAEHDRPRVVTVGAHLNADGPASEIDLRTPTFASPSPSEGRRFDPTERAFGDTQTPVARRPISRAPIALGVLGTIGAGLLALAVLHAGPFGAPVADSCSDQTVGACQVPATQTPATEPGTCNDQSPGMCEPASTEADGCQSDPGGCTGPIEYTLEASHSASGACGPHVDTAMTRWTVVSAGTYAGDEAVVDVTGAVTQTLHLTVGQDGVFSSQITVPKPTCEGEWQITTRLRTIDGRPAVFVAPPTAEVPGASTVTGTIRLDVVANQKRRAGACESIGGRSGNVSLAFESSAAGGLKTTMTVSPAGEVTTGPLAAMRLQTTGMRDASHPFVHYDVTFAGQTGTGTSEVEYQDATTNADCLESFAVRIQLNGPLPAG
jgi:hypothetical protein